LAAASAQAAVALEQGAPTAAVANALDTLDLHQQVAAGRMSAGDRATRTQARASLIGALSVALGASAEPSSGVAEEAASGAEEAGSGAVDAVAPVVEVEVEVESLAALLARATADSAEMDGASRLAATRLAGDLAARIPTGAPRSAADSCLEVLSNVLEGSEAAAWAGGSDVDRCELRQDLVTEVSAAANSVLLALLDIAGPVVGSSLHLELVGVRGKPAALSGDTISVGGGYTVRVPVEAFGGA
jgi:hypothetical protein